PRARRRTSKRARGPSPRWSLPAGRSPRQFYTSLCHHTGAARDGDGPRRRRPARNRRGWDRSASRFVSGGLGWRSASSADPHKHKGVQTRSARFGPFSVAFALVTTIWLGLGRPAEAAHSRTSIGLSGLGMRLLTEDGLGHEGPGAADQFGFA